MERSFWAPGGRAPPRALAGAGWPGDHRLGPADPGYAAEPRGHAGRGSHLGDDRAIEGHERIVRPVKPGGLKLFLCSSRGWVGVGSVCVWGCLFSNYQVALGPAWRRSPSRLRNGASTQRLGDCRGRDVKMDLLG